MQTHRALSVTALFLIICSLAYAGPPPPEETCDGLDNDLDGEIDEDLTRPCQNSCASGTETCAAGQWLACSARPCCDITLGPDAGPVSLCPAAEAMSAVVCLAPGNYYVPAGCAVRSSLVGIGDPAATIIEGDLILSQSGAVRIQGLTVTGFLHSEWPLDLLENRLLGGASLHNIEGASFGSPLLQVSNNEIHRNLNVAFRSFVHANDITGEVYGLGLGQDSSDYHAATENHIRGTGDFGIQVGELATYLARNVIEGFDVGISIYSYSRGLQIVANRIVARSSGIDGSLLGAGIASVLRNDVHAGGPGINLRSDLSRIEGNQVVRDPDGSGPSEGCGIALNILVPDRLVALPTSFRDNTIVGGGACVRQQAQTVPVQISGNIIVADGGLGVFICALDACPASPPYALAPTHNDVFGSAAPWVGTDDPTGHDGNISADPLFRDPGAGDYRLTPGSPCIDAGDTGFLSVDLTGGARVQDGDADGQAIQDMGAREADEPCHDGDGDGFGSPGRATCAAGAATDCDDGNPQVHPGSVDLPGNSVDEDCDGSPGACDPGRAEGWKSHGQFVRCVTQEVEALVGRGAITEDLGEVLINNAARSGVGK